MALEIGLVILLAYLLGSIPTAVWVGKLFFSLDVREHGSKNAGATNAIRVLGWKAGLPVFIFDVFKGWLAVMLADFLLKNQLDGDHLVLLKIGLAVLVVFGHVFPVFAGFRGGKGVATLLGVGIAIFPYSVWVTLGIFILILAITGYVSMGSILSAVMFPVIEIFIFKQEHPWLIALALMVAVFIPITHRKNIKRLLNGTESRFRPTKSGQQKGGSV